MRGRLAAFLGIAVALACESDPSSNDTSSVAGGGTSPNGGSMPKGGSTSTGGASGTSTVGLGGASAGASGGISGTSTSGGSGTSTGGTSGIGTGGSDGTGEGGEGAWSCQASDTACVCGPVMSPNVDDCGTNWPCCFSYATELDGIERAVCACDDVPDEACTERVNGLFQGRRETSCPP